MAKPSTPRRLAVTNLQRGLYDPKNAHLFTGEAAALAFAHVSRLPHATNTDNPIDFPLESLAPTQPADKELYRKVLRRRADKSKAVEVDIDRL